MTMNGTKILFTPKRHVQRNYKKPKTKAQIQAGKQTRVFKTLQDCTANCGEDKVLQSYQALYKSHIYLKEALDRSKWRGINKTLLQQSLILNDVMFIPNPNGCKDWPKAKIRYKYRANGIELGISNGNRWEKPAKGTLPNIVTKMGPEALVCDLDIANNFINKTLEAIVDKLWSHQSHIEGTGG